MINEEDITSGECYLWQKETLGMQILASLIALICDSYVRTRGAPIIGSAIGNA